MNKDCLLLIAQQAHLLWFEDQKNHRKFNNKLYGSVYRKKIPLLDDEDADNFFLKIIRYENLEASLTYFRNLPGINDVGLVYYRCERCHIKCYSTQYDCCLPCASIVATEMDDYYNKEKEFSKYIDENV